jgi:TatD DNase family protein
LDLSLVDSHAHLASSAFRKDREAVIERARDAGVEAIIEVGTDLAASKAAVGLAREWDLVYAAVGIHPHSADGADADVLAEIEDLAQEPKVVAIGEIGLDYYRDLSPRAVQRSVFAQQLELAHRLQLPVVVHCRDAIADVLAALRGWDGGGVLHSYLSGVDRLEDVLHLSLYVGVSGPVTYPDAHEARLVAAQTPTERLLVETDCPYLTPVPHRGERNEPAFVHDVVEGLARARGATAEAVSRATAENARRAFGLP